jgi:hypothetical protein
MLDAQPAGIGRKLPPIGIVGVHDPLDGDHAVFEAAGEVVQLVQQLLVFSGDRPLRLPLGM